MKIVDYGFSGSDMLQIDQSGESIATLPGTPFVTGVQDFNGYITHVEYVDNHTLISLDDGKVLKVFQTGGTGKNMFSIEESAYGFSHKSGYTQYYVGHSVFQNKVVDILYENGMTLLSMEGGKVLKVQGIGGSGANMFYVTETQNGFTNVQGSPYYIGHANFLNTVNNMIVEGGQLLISSGNKLIKFNSLGGSGANMFAISETVNSVNTIVGWNFLMGYSIFNQNVSHLVFENNKLLISTGEKLLKVDGFGGTGANMFNVTETSIGFSGSTNSFYEGHATFLNPIHGIWPILGNLFISFPDGRLLKLNGFGGNGANMFALVETSTTFGALSGYNSAYLGYQSFPSPTTSISEINSDILVGMELDGIQRSGWLFKIQNSGGNGSNMFNINSEFIYRDYIFITPFIGVQEFSCFGTDVSVFVEQYKMENITNKAASRSDLMEEQVQEEIFLYPNPTKGVVKFNLPSHWNDTSVNIKVIGLDGKVVFNQIVREMEGDYKIDLTSCLSGLYICTLTPEKGIPVTVKINKAN